VIAFSKIHLTHKPCSYSHLPTLRDDDILERFIPGFGCTRVFYLVHDVHTGNHLAEDDMLVVQERRRNCGEEELRSVGIWPRILEIIGVCYFLWEDPDTHCHTQETWFIVLYIEVLVCELGSAVDVGGPGPVAIQKIATLYHEVFDLGVWISRDVRIRHGTMCIAYHSMEFAPFVALRPASRVL